MDNRVDSNDNSVMDSIDSVFSTVEILELILHYATAGESFNKSRNLRLVCKLWRDFSFKGLCDSTNLPIVNDLEDDTIEGDENCTVITLEECQGKFPTRTSLETLSDPKLPLRVRFNGNLSPHIEPFLTEYNKYLAVIEIKYRDKLRGKLLVSISSKPPERGLFDKVVPVKEIQYTSDNFPAVFPSLRTLTVYFEFGWCKIVKDTTAKLLLGAKKLRLFKYDLHKSKPPKLSSKLTHLRLYKEPEDIWEDIVSNELSKLVSLQIDIPSYNEAPVDCVILTQILNNVGPKLETFEIRNTPGWNGDIRTVNGTIELPFMEKLRRLCIDIPFSSTNSVYSALPNLQNLSFTIGEKAISSWQHLEVGNFNNLRDVTITLATRGRNRFEYDLVSYMESRSEVFRKLKSFKLCVKVPYYVAFGFFRQVFPSQISSAITHLELRLERDYSTDKHFYHCLAGVVFTSEIPTDESLWPGFLKGKPNNITNLTRLESLDVHGFQELFFGRFIFTAAFFQMPNLKALRLTNGMLVWKDLIQTWKSEGRSISFK